MCLERYHKSTRKASPWTVDFVPLAILKCSVLSSLVLSASKVEAKDAEVFEIGYSFGQDLDIADVGTLEIPWTARLTTLTSVY